MMTLDQFAAVCDRKASGDFAARGYEPALRECVPIVQEDIAQHFADKIDSEGQGWPAHSPATVARYGAHPLLVLSGALLAAAAHNGFGSFVFVGSDLMRVGVNKGRIPYAGVHQYGHGKIPQREYMYLSDEAIRACSSVIVAYAAHEVF